MILLLLKDNDVTAFSTSSSVFVPQKQPIIVPSKTNGVGVELPDFDDFFAHVKKASPLAELAMEGRDGGFFVMDDTRYPDMKWKTIESSKRKTIHQIQKIDNYQNLSPPLLRFRASLKGPCIGNRFATFLMDINQRKQWDDQIDEVYEIHPVRDLNSVNAAQQRRHRQGNNEDYGECTLCGVGYTLTKPNFIVDQREQLTLCGIQEFPSTGATVIWGVEMDDKYDDALFPKTSERHTRARSHLFSTTVVPTGENEFDVEYVLQLDIGGRLPTFVTTPVVIKNVQKMFEYAKEYFGAGEGGELDRYLKMKEAAMESAQE